MDLDNYTPKMNYDEGTKFHSNTEWPRRHNFNSKKVVVECRDEHSYVAWVISKYFSQYYEKRDRTNNKQVYTCSSESKAKEFETAVWSERYYWQAVRNQEVRDLNEQFDPDNPDDGEGGGDGGGDGEDEDGNNNLIKIVFFVTILIVIIIILY